MSTLRDQQLAFAAHLRDPSSQPMPAGFDAQATAVYRRLYRNNIAQLLAGNFPVIRASVDAATWTALVEGFCRDTSVRTPLFPRIGGEFARHLQVQAPTAAPPWLAELALHEWTETDLQLDPTPLPPHDATGDVLAGVPVPSPWMRLRRYDWPVHRIGPAFTPAERPARPTWLLARRDDEGTVRFSELSEWTARLLQLLVDNTGDTGEQRVLRLAAAAGCGGDPGFLADARALLLRLRGQGCVLGVRSAA